MRLADDQREAIAKIREIMGEKNEEMNRGKQFEEFMFVVFREFVPRSHC